MNLFSKIPAFKIPDEFFHPYTLWLYKWRFLIVVLGIFLGAFFGYQATKLESTSDYRVWFGKNNPDLIAMEKHEKTYVAGDNAIIAIQPESGDVFNKKTLELISFLTEKSWTLPYALRVDSVTNFQYSYAEEDTMTVAPLVEDTENLDDAEIQKIKSIASTEQLLVGLYLAKDNKTTSVMVTFHGESDPEKVKHRPEEIMMAVQNLVEEAKQKFPDHIFALTGSIPMGHAFKLVTDQDAAYFWTPMLILMSLLIAVTLRSVTGAIGTVMVIVISSAIAMGAANVLMNVTLTSISSIAPVVILTLAIADSIHFLASYYSNLNDGDSKLEGMEKALKSNLASVFLTSATTAIGFLTMNTSDAPPFHDFGNIAAIGVVFAFLYSVSFLPAFVLIFPKRKYAYKEHSSAILKKFSDFIIRKHVAVSWIVFFTTIGLAAALPRMEFNDNFVTYFSKDSKFRIDTEFIEKNLTGVNGIEYSFSCGESQCVGNPAFLSEVEKFSKWLEGRPEIVYQASILSVIKRLNKNMHADNPDYYVLPDDQALAAQYLFLYEMSLPYGLDLQTLLNTDKSAIRVFAAFKNISAQEIRDFKALSEQWMKENLSENMHTQGVGPSIMFSFISKRNIDSMISGTFMALVTISILLIFALRSVKIGLLSLIPNLIPGIMGLGIWALLVGEVGMASSIVCSMSMGIIVDDTVHFLYKFLHARNDLKQSKEDAIRYALLHAGRGVFFTTVIIVSGFAILAFSGFRVTHDLGLLNVVIVSIALTADFLILPALLLKFSK